MYSKIVLVYVNNAMNGVDTVIVQLVVCKNCAVVHMFVLPYDACGNLEFNLEFYLG